MVAAATAAPTSSSFTSVYNPTVYFQANLLGKGLALAFPGRRTRLDFLPRFRIAHSSLVDNNSAGSILEAAAKRTVNTFIKTGMVVGLGSGAGSRLAIQYLGQQLRLGNIKDIVGIPTSVDSASEAAKAGIPLDQYQDNFQIDFAFSDAEAIEEGTLISVIGRRRLQGEESIVQEKNILRTADRLVFFATETQYKTHVDGSIPVLVKSYNWMETAEEIDDLFLGDAEVWRRPAIGHAGPTGGDFPLVTREGHNVLDVIFTSPILNLAEVAKSLENIAGVADHGVISKIPCIAVIASEDGVSILENPPKNA